jgi:hypothetical protein
LRLVCGWVLARLTLPVIVPALTTATLVEVLLTA